MESFERLRRFSRRESKFHWIRQGRTGDSDAKNFENDIISKVKPELRFLNTSLNLNPF